MSWTIQPFNNTDLHNIYEAIVSGGGGGDTLAGQLLDGSVEPSVPTGFYPANLNAILTDVEAMAGILANIDAEAANIQNNTNFINNLFQGEINPTNLGGFYPSKLASIEGYNSQIYGLIYGDEIPNPDNASSYPYWAKHTSERTENSNDLLNGLVEPTGAGFYVNAVQNIDVNTAQTNGNTTDIKGYFAGTLEPYNYSGFYPTNILAQSSSLSNIEGAANSINGLILGTSNPSDDGGFYPSHIIEDTTMLINIWGEAQKIADHTDHIQGLTSASLVFGTDTGGTAQKASGTGYATPDLAAAAAVNFMNAKSGSNIVINLNFTDGGGVNGHSWTLVFVTLL